MKESFITFECKGEKFAIPATELSGAEREIPYVEYPGLPLGVKGIALWNGKVLPIRVLSSETEKTSKRGTFLICKTDPEFILYVAGTVKVVPIELDQMKDDKLEFEEKTYQILNIQNMSQSLSRDTHAA